MRVLLLTVAGLSSRFSRSVGYECLKCIYHENGIEESLLYRMLHRGVEFDRTVIVGGFQFHELEEVINRDFPGMREKIQLVYNGQYREYGSGYSLYKGLDAVVGLEFDELVFAEGDLYVDRESFRRVCSSEQDAVTTNSEAILAEKAVAFYYDREYGIHYLYDTGHSLIQIQEPFRGIFNSGQIWKFTQTERLRESFGALSGGDWRGTNLALIQQYFGGLGRDEYRVINLDTWINCNTIEDFRKIRGIKGKDRG